MVVRYEPPFPLDDENPRAFNERLGQAVARLWAEADGTLALPTGPKVATWRRV